MHRHVLQGSFISYSIIRKAVSFPQKIIIMYDYYVTLITFGFCNKYLIVYDKSNRIWHYSIHITQTYCYKDGLGKQNKANLPLLFFFCSLNLLGEVLKLGNYWGLFHIRVCFSYHFFKHIPWPNSNWERDNNFATTDDSGLIVFSCL